VGHRTDLDALEKKKFPFTLLGIERKITGFPACSLYKTPNTAGPSNMGPSIT
jgi:hypothetical protein